MQHLTLRKLACAVALSLMPCTAAFAVSTWNFSTCNSNAANNSGGVAFGNTWSCSGSNGGGSVAVSGWATTGNSGTTYQNAYVSPQGGSGFGIANQGGGLSPGRPNHAADNAGFTDMFALKFDTKVDLTGVTIGWWQTDSDISVLRYTGADAPTVSGKNIPGLLSNGWKLVGDYSDLGTGATRAVNTADGNVGPNDGASSWWLISAYNASYGGASWSAGNDYFKLLSVAGNVAAPPSGNRVPEPASLALVGLAMLGAAGGLRRKRRSMPELSQPV